MLRRSRGRNSSVSACRPRLHSDYGEDGMAEQNMLYLDVDASSDDRLNDDVDIIYMLI